MVNIFPFKVMSRDTGHYIRKPWSNVKTFLKYKPEDMRWYAYDIEVISENYARFIVYDMKDFCFGGIGMKTGEFECFVDREDLQPFINIEYRDLARTIEQREYDLAREKRVQQILRELRNDDSTRMDQQLSS